MKTRISTCGVLVCLSVAHGIVAAAAPTRAEVDAWMGIANEGDRVRGQLDAVGYATSAAQMEDLLRAIGSSVGPGNPAIVGGICPHDDHLYAAAVTDELIRRIAAPRVVLFGVFHKARLWDLENRLVFDDFAAWRGPWGPVPVAQDLRAGLIDRLPDDAVVVSNTMHCCEHSLEGIVPFLQYHIDSVEIVPILVPYMGWERLEELSTLMSAALADIMRTNGWRLGRDLAVVVSSDAVHYGPDFDHAPFGVGIEAYAKGVERDRTLIAAHLEGVIDSGRLAGLYEALVDPEHPRTYRLPWCGRFSVPCADLPYCR